VHILADCTPSATKAPERAGDVLAFLHHINVSYARTNLLKRFSFLGGDSKLYLDGTEHRFHAENFALISWCIAWGSL
jgi:hypothetical protein